MNFRQIEAFRAVMIAGSATAAAQMLFITQPAVSRLLNSLEEGVGFKLFERRNNRLMPTQEGRSLYAIVEQSFAGLDHIAQAANAIRTASTGKLRIASTPLIAHCVLPSVVAEFSKKHPEVRMEMRHGSREFVVDCIASQAFDIGIEVPPIDVPGVKESLLVKQHAVCVVPVGHPLSAKTQVNAHDISGLRFIAPEAGSRFRFAIEQALLSHNVQVNIVVETSTQEAICRLVAREVGIGLVSPYVARSASGLPITFKKFLPPVQISYSTLFPTERSISILSQNFVFILREELKNM